MTWERLTFTEYDRKVPISEGHYLLGTLRHLKHVVVIVQTKALNSSLLPHGVILKPFASKMCDTIVGISEGFHVFQSPCIEFEYLRSYYLFLAIYYLDLKTSQVRIKHPL